MDLNNEMTILASCFNQDVWSNLQSIKASFPWKSPVAKKLIEVANDLPRLSDITLTSVLSELMVKEELTTFLDMVRQYREVKTSEEISAITKSNFNYYKKELLSTILMKYSDNPLKVIEEVKDKIPTELASLIKPEPLGARDAQEVMETEIGDSNRIFQSNYSVIRNATPYQGYMPGQLVMFCGKPGGGKSATMLEEEILNILVNPNIKILHMALGDMTRTDFICRFTAVITQTEYAKVVIDPSKYFTPEVREAANCIDLVCLPSRGVSADEIVAFVENSETYYDMIVIDYDSNVKTKSGDSENMYEAGGELYDKLTSLARPENGLARLVFVASQPKTGYWDKEIIPLEGAGESSRKQHVVDLMITMGVAHSNHGIIGKMHIAKCRRGSAGGVMCYKMSKCGKIEEIEASQYLSMKTYSGN